MDAVERAGTRRARSPFTTSGLCLRSLQRIDWVLVDADSCCSSSETQPPTKLRLSMVASGRVSLAGWRLAFRLERIRISPNYEVTSIKQAGAKVPARPPQKQRSCHLLSSLFRALARRLPDGSSSRASRVMRDNGALSDQGGDEKKPRLRRTCSRHVSDMCWRSSNRTRALNTSAGRLLKGRCGRKAARKSFALLHSDRYTLHDNAVAGSPQARPPREGRSDWVVTHATDDASAPQPGAPPASKVVGRPRRRPGQRLNTLIHSHLRSLVPTFLEAGRSFPYRR